MRILMLTASLPYPPSSGGAIRTYGLIHGLYTAGYEVTLLSFHDGQIQPDSTPLVNWCRRIETVPSPSRTKRDRLCDLLLSSKADIEQRMYSEAMCEKLLTLVYEIPYDLIQFEGIEVACYLPFVYQMGTKAKLCFDTFNAEYALQRTIFEVDRQDIKRWPAALYSLVQTGRITRFEREVCQQADCVIAVSPEDADALRGFRPDRRIFVVPNGIFVNDYVKPDLPLDLGKNVLVFTGKMDYRPNVDAMIWFANDILPLVEQQIPDVQLYIVGQKPHARLESLRGRASIHLTGRVESVQPYLHAADVYIAPLRMGSGTRLKILEAMASGCAVVATPAAASGLLSETKEAMIIANKEADMAQAVIKLLRNPAQQQQLGAAARASVRQHYDWSVLVPRLLAAYDSALKETNIG